MQDLLCLICLIFTVFGSVFGLGDSTCKDIRVMENYSERKSLGLWIKYGGNIKCRNCCVTFTLTQNKPGQFIVTNRNYTSRGPGYQEVVMNADKISNAAYSMGGGIVYLLSGDYHTYVVGYIQPGDFGLYVRSLDVMNDSCTKRRLLKMFDEQSKICGVKYYPYNINHNCRYMPKDNN